MTFSGREMDLLNRERTGGHNENLKKGGTSLVELQTSPIHKKTHGVMN